MTMVVNLNKIEVTEAYYKVQTEALKLKQIHDHTYILHTYIIFKIETIAWSYIHTYKQNKKIS